MRVIVTGAAGFIGYHLAERLVSGGHSVTAIDCFTDYYDRRLKEMNAADLAELGVKVVNHDLAAGDAQSVIGDAEVICHLAAQPGNSAATSLDKYVRNNIWATHYLASAAIKLPGLKLFINCSTSSVYGFNATESEEAAPQPVSHYGVTKLAAEQLVLALHRDKGMPACSLRLFSVYGPRERPDKLYPLLIQCLAKDQALPMFEGSAKHSRSFTYVGDIVDGILAAMDNPSRCVGQIINLGSDTEITTARGIEIVEKIVGRKVKIDPKPRRPGDQSRTCANIEKARRLLNYHPNFTPEKGLALEVEWFMKRLYR
jgi:UDP-glucuronate 4-epimerase